MDTCFREIGKSGAISDMLLIFAMGADDEDWMPYYNFQALPIPLSLLDDPLLHTLSQKREFQCGMLKIPPNTVYNWHVDTDRNCGLNMLVYDDGQSKCIFAPEGLKIVMPTVELRYAPNTFYAFNAKVMHTVINFTTPRYMFSLEFIGKDYGLTYDQLLADLKELGYGS